MGNVRSGLTGGPCPVCNSAEMVFTGEQRTFAQDITWYETACPSCGIIGGEMYRNRPLSAPCCDHPERAICAGV